MRSPKQRGSAINTQRFNGWLTSYGTYWNPPTRGSVEQWLEQFDAERDLGARILDAVLFFGQAQITRHYLELVSTLDGWSKTDAERRGKWRFVAFSGSSGESGDTMLHNFRLATGMARNVYNSLFCHRSEIMDQELGPDDTLVLVDDFSGSGKQACDSWKAFFSEMVAEGPRVILLLVAATSTARTKISEETEMEVVCGHTLAARDNIFDPACLHFTAAEKAQVLRYCRKADRNRPEGWGKCGLLMVFSHRCPNNSIPILHARSAHWDPIFPRHEA